MGEFFTAFIVVGYLYPMVFPIVFFSLFTALFSVQIDSIVNQFYLFHDDQAKTLSVSCRFFFKVVDDAEQVPLNIHLGFAIQNVAGGGSRSAISSLR